MSTDWTLESLRNNQSVTSRLQDAGLTGDMAKAKASLFQEAANTLIEKGADSAGTATPFFVPGRIEVLGKHTDYAGGPSMIVAADRGFCIVVLPRDDSEMVITDSGNDEEVRFTIDAGLCPEPGHWSNYPMTVAQRVAVNFPGPLKGANIAFCSDLPPASGMSSSSAMLTGFFLAMSAVNDLKSRAEYIDNIDSIEQLASYCGTIENGSSFGTLEGSKGVGTFGGSEDHTAILCSMPGNLNVYSYCPVRLERRMDFPGDYTFAVASSGVIAEKTGAAMEKYNSVSALCRQSVTVWNEATGENETYPADIVAKVGAERFLETITENGGPEIKTRIEQFIAESDRIIPAASDAIGSGDVKEFGRQVRASQELAEEKLGNQVPETIYLAKSATDFGAVAASAFGAGFGGSVWAMCRKDLVDEFIAQWSENYAEQFPEPATRSRFFSTSPGPAAFEL